MAGVSRCTTDEVKEIASKVVEGANFQGEGSKFYQETFKFEENESSKDPFVHFNPSSLKGRKKEK